MADMGMIIFSVIMFIIAALVTVILLYYIMKNKEAAKEVAEKHEDEIKRCKTELAKYKNPQG